MDEQSAIRAGDGGFQVDVGGNTSLQGGQITSSEAAVQQGKNRFTTGGEPGPRVLSSMEDAADAARQHLQHQNPAREILRWCQHFGSGVAVADEHVLHPCHQPVDAEFAEAAVQWRVVLAWACERVFEPGRVDLQPGRPTQFDPLDGEAWRFVRRQPFLVGAVVWPRRRLSRFLQLLLTPAVPLTGLALRLLGLPALDFRDGLLVPVARSLSLGRQPDADEQDQADTCRSRARAAPDSKG